MKRLNYFLATFFASQVMLSAPCFADQYSLYGSWPSNNGGNANLGVSNDSILNTSNVSKLVPYWTGTNHSLNNISDPNINARHVAVQSTPVIADGVVYYADSAGILYAYKTTSSTKANGNIPDGTLLWSIQLKNDLGQPDSFMESPVLTQSTVFIGGRSMHAVDRATGTEKWSAVFDPNLAAAFDQNYGPQNNFVADIQPSQLMVAGNLVIYGIGFSEEVLSPTNPDGSQNSAKLLNAYNNAVGQIIAFYQDKQPAGQSQVAWRFTATTKTGAITCAYQNAGCHGNNLNASDTYYGPGSGSFGGGAVDTARHLFFIGTNNNYATRFNDASGNPIAGPLTNSLVAIDYTTGKKVWSYQYAANDVCGYDVYHTSPPYGYRCGDDANHDLDVEGHPQLFSVNVPGQGLTDVVGARGKDGTYRIFDRATGTPYAQIQVDGAAGFNLSVGLDPVVNNGTLYILSGAWIQNGISYSIDFVPNFYDPFEQSSHLRSINLQNLVSYTMGNNLNKQVLCVGNISPNNRCTGNLETVPSSSSIFNWEKTIFPSQVETSSGMTYNNGMLFISDFIGIVRVIDASSGNQISQFGYTNQTFQTQYAYEGPGTTPYLGLVQVGGVSIDNGIVFVPFGIDFQGFSYPFGGIAAFALPPQ